MEQCNVWDSKMRRGTSASTYTPLMLPCTGEGDQCSLWQRLQWAETPGVDRTRSGKGLQ